MAKLSKRQKKIAEGVDTSRVYGIVEAIAASMGNASSKFD